MSVGRKDRIPDLPDGGLVDDEGQPLDERRSSHLERLEPQGLSEAQVGVGQQREREVESLEDLPLILRILGR
jgi:hypothetical protein